jgi:2-aminoadipate transaminase
MGGSGGPRFSQRVSGLEASPVREILAVLERPGMISFAGGLPAPETFPEITLASVPRSALQYGPTEGDTGLRLRVAENLRSVGLACSAEQVLILSGSQQGIDLVAKLFVDVGTPVAVEAPTYLAALQVLRYFGASLQRLDISRPHAGMDPRSPPALAYVVPTFQNPTGYCYTGPERAALAAVCDELSVPVFEDDPYRDLAYEACDRTPVCTHVKRTSWIYQSSFSKSFAPGLRLGYLAASPDLMPFLIRLKQASDLHSSRVSQWVVLGQLQDAHSADRLREVVAVYRQKRDAFAAALGEHFGRLATWQVPRGGLFFWLRLNVAIDTRRLLPQAIEKGVAFMPGESFFPDRPNASGALRLNFSHASEGQVDRGLSILAKLFREASG